MATRRQNRHRTVQRRHHRSFKGLSQDVYDILEDYMPLRSSSYQPSSYGSSWLRFFEPFERFFESTDGRIFLQILLRNAVRTSSLKKLVVRGLVADHIHPVSWLRPFQIRRSCSSLLCCTRTVRRPYAKVQVPSIHRQRECYLTDCNCLSFGPTAVPGPQPTDDVYYVYVYS